MTHEKTLVHVLTETTPEEAEREYNDRKRKTREMIRHELKTQNGQATSYPMFCVMKYIHSKDHDMITVTREIFFTRSEAEHYIVDSRQMSEFKHEPPDDLFIYVKSGYRNEGWKFARELMLNYEEATQ